MGGIVADISLRPAQNLGPDRKEPLWSPHVSIQIKRKEGAAVLTLKDLRNTESGILPNLLEFGVFRPRANWTLPIQLAPIAGQ